jgi:hypothetical protein
MPPAFGSDGTDPPLESDPTLVERGFSLVGARSFESFKQTGMAIHYVLGGATRVAGTDIPEDVLETGSWVSDNNPFGSLGPAAYHEVLMGGGPKSIALNKVDEWRRIALEHGELRRISLTQHWRRDDVTQLAPGTATNYGTHIETGLTISASEQLSASLGLKVPIGGWVGVELGAKLKGWLNKDIAITQKTREDRTVFLDNRNPKLWTATRFAVWHLVETVWVHFLNFDLTKVPRFEWKLISRTPFEKTVVNTTSSKDRL